MRIGAPSATVVLVVAAGAFGACQAGPETDDLAEQEAQDSAWGYKRDSAAPTRFLVQNGKGSLAETNAYYAQTVEQFSPSTAYTLATWQSQYLSGPTVGALYRNKTELGFWRDMTCTQTIRRGSGGCTVTNYKNETDKAQQQPNLGTVAMNVSPKGFARFYVFLPNGQLSPTALLDDEGPKFLPRLCTVCHGGHRVTPDTQPDLGSIFREFMPSQLQPRTGLARPDAEAQWFALNQAIRTANESIRGESEGSPAGVDHAKAAMSGLLDALYPDLAPPARSLTDPALTPVSWTSDPKNTQLWTGLVAPYCMGCHRHNADDWSIYGNFEYLSEASDRGPGLHDYIGGGGTPAAHPYPFMPQSELQYNLLTADHAAQRAVDAWLPCTGGQTCVPTNPCHKGATVCPASGLVCGDTGQALPDGTACGDQAVCLHGACTTTPCNAKVLVLGDIGDFDAYEYDTITNSLGQVGLHATTLPHGIGSFIGQETASDTFAAILVVPTTEADADMPLAGQQAILSQIGHGNGLLLVEPFTQALANRRFQSLAALSLLQFDSSQVGHDSRFHPTNPNHPIWTGVAPDFHGPADFFNVGHLVNGGSTIATVSAAQSPDGHIVTGPGVVVRDRTASSGRVAQFATSLFFDGGGVEPRLQPLFVNATRWAAGCL